MAPTESETAEPQSSTNAYTRPVLLTSQTATPAMAQVLALPELLREILNYLPFQDLFTSSRTCGGFKDTTRDEKRLREKLKCEAYKWVYLEEFQPEEHRYYIRLYDDDDDIPEGYVVVEDLHLCPLLSWDRRQRAPGSPPPRIRFDVKKYLADPETWRPVYIFSRPQFEMPEFTVDLDFSVEATSGRVTVISSSTGFYGAGAVGLTIGRVMDETMGTTYVCTTEGNSIDRQWLSMELPSSNPTLAEIIREVEEEKGAKVQLVEGQCFLLFE